MLKHPNAKVKKKRAAIRLKKPVKLEGGELDNLSFDEDQNDVEDEQHEHDVEDEQHEHDVEDKQDEDETEEDEDSVTYQCLDCDVSLTLSECYPITARQDPRKHLLPVQAVRGEARN